MTITASNVENKKDKNGKIICSKSQIKRVLYIPDKTDPSSIKIDINGSTVIVKGTRQ